MSKCCSNQPKQSGLFLLYSLFIIMIFFVAIYSLLLLL